MAKRGRAVNRIGAAKPLLAGAAIALVLAGCGTTATREPAHTGSIDRSAVITPSDLTRDQALAAVQHWGSTYSLDEKDTLAALNYAAALRAAGETNQAVAVMRKATIYHPEDREVLAAFGKALAADGQFQQALATIRRAQRTDNPDWQLLATEGGILDSLGNHEKARDLYRQALVLAPGEPQILNNLGLSYALTNELDKAEAALREAAASPRATLKTSQNLALVLSLRGKHDEAKLITGEPASASPTSPVQEDTWKDLIDSN